MCRSLSSQYTLHHTHKTPSYPNLTLLLQSSTTLTLVPNTRLHLPLQLRSVQAAVLAHTQQGVLPQEGLQDGLQVLLLQQVLFYRSLMITKMVNCYDRYLLWKRNISLRWQWAESPKGFWFTVTYGVVLPWWVPKLRNVGKIPQQSCRILSYVWLSGVDLYMVHVIDDAFLSGTMKNPLSGVYITT